jgi:putative hemolysin
MENKTSNGSKKIFSLASLCVLVIILIVFSFYFMSLEKQKNTKQTNTKNTQTQMANPASNYCIENGGKSEIINNENGQSGICVFSDGSQCDEWAFFRKECEMGQNKVDINLEIKELEKVLTEEKGIDFSKMKIRINENLGKYISGSIIPLDSNIGGAYLYAEKIDGKWNIVASGNGQINCNIFDTYKDFPISLITECVNEQGQIERRDLPL